MKKKMLFIIEAPGKIDSFFKSACHAFGHNSLEVWATGGLIAEMSDKGAINPETLKIARETLNENGHYFVNRILKERNKNKELNFHRIYICTDPDREGEHIAWQIFRILNLYTENGYINRAYSLDITPEGLRNMEVRDTLNEGMLLSRMARRVMDRLIPELVSHELQLPNWKGVGRVQIGGLEVAHRLEQRWRPFQLKGYWKHEDGTFFYTEQYTKDVEVKKIWERFTKKTYFDVESEVVSQTKIIPPPLPHTYLSLVKRFEEQPPQEIAAAIQDAYMAGRIGYPRTNRLHWTPYIQRNIAAMSDKLHLNTFLRNDWHEALPEMSINEWNVAGHPAMHPTNLALTQPPSGYNPLSLAVEKELLAHSCATLMTPARVKERELTVYLKDDALFQPIILKQWEIVQHGWLKAYERADMSYPFKEIPPLNLRRQQIFFSQQVPMGQAFIQDMHAYHVGQPHNSMSLLQNLQKRDLISGYSILTHEGIALREQIHKRFPKLLQVQYAEEFDKAIHSIGEHPQTYTKTIRLLLEHLDIDIVHLMNGDSLYRDNYASQEEKDVLPFESRGFSYEFKK